MELVCLFFLWSACRFLTLFREGIRVVVGVRDRKTTHQLSNVHFGRMVRGRGRGVRGEDSDSQFLDPGSVHSMFDHGVVNHLTQTDVVARAVGETVRALLGSTH